MKLNFSNTLFVRNRDNRNIKYHIGLQSEFYGSQTGGGIYPSIRSKTDFSLIINKNQ